MLKIKYLIVASIFATALFGCKKEKDATPSAVSNTSASEVRICGQTKTVTLLAGQTINSGTVSVSNDETNLYVTYSTIGGWQLQKTHLYVGDCSLIPSTPTGNPKIGLFPYQTSHSPRVTSFTYTLPLSGLGACYCVAAHAEVVKVENGIIVQSETGWGEGTVLSSGSWAMKFEYCTQVCEEVVVDTCYNEETAWANGIRFEDRGNWATYVTYTGEAQSVILYAGQTQEAGTVSISAASGGNVTISIALSEGWSLQDVAEGVKIQGYEAAPSGNPSPGLFTTYKGNDLTVTIPQSNYYGIHLDVRKAVVCE